MSTYAGLFCLLLIIAKMGLFGIPAGFHYDPDLMNSVPANPPSAVARPLVHRLFLVVLFFAALLPRLAAIGRYVTPDEPGWVYRSILFREAWLHGQWAETLTAGHPGVITTWLGATAIGLQLWLQPASRAAYDWL